MIIKEEKLWDLVTKLVPSIGLNDGQKDALVNQKAKAVMILTLTIKDNLLKYHKLALKDNLFKYIARKDEPHEVWEILLNRFDIKNEARTMFLQNALYTMKMEGDSMEEFLYNIKDITTMLNKIREEVKDKTLVNIVLHAHPASYESFK
jgi:LPS O-antigen subunit length determinant protein (WzzB/FepE family)